MTPPEHLCPTTKLPACDPEEIRMDNRRKVHLDKGINLPTILTVLTMIGAFFVWGLSQERRVAKLEEAILRSDEAQRLSRQETKQDLREVTHRLDMIQSLLTQRERK